MIKNILFLTYRDRTCQQKMKSYGAVHTCTLRGEWSCKTKAAFLQGIPQPSINTEPSSAFANKRLLFIKVSKKADLDICFFDMTRDGDLFFFYNVLRVHITLRTFLSTNLPRGYPSRQVTGNTKASTLPWNYFLLQMRDVEGWAERCNAAICATTCGGIQQWEPSLLASWHRTGP